MSRADRADRTVFLEVIEWFDETGAEILHRIPEEGSGEIKYGAQLICRESQSAVLFYHGRAADAFGPGRHTLRLRMSEERDSRGRGHAMRVLRFTANNPAFKNAP